MTTPQWEALTATDFEHLCLDLLRSLGFKNVRWRQGGSDRGRDLEAIWQETEPGGLVFNQRWFAECKRYLSGGVPVGELTEKIAWADAERPDYLLIMTNAHLTTQAKDWIDALAPTKPYRVRVWEGEHLATLLASLPDLWETYFNSVQQAGPVTSLRHRRLALDYRRMEDLQRQQSERVSIDRAVGDPPYVYLLTLRCRTVRGVSGDAPLWIDEVTVRISLPKEYPHQQPFVEILSQVFHPNVQSKVLCTGWHNSSPGLDILVIGIAEILSFHNYNLLSPMNIEAAEWFRKHENVCQQISSANMRETPIREADVVEIRRATDARG
jgi:ubiquitin-protein ligase